MKRITVNISAKFLGALTAQARTGESVSSVARRMIQRGLGLPESEPNAGWGGQRPYPPRQEYVWWFGDNEPQTTTGRTVWKDGDGSTLTILASVTEVPDRAVAWLREAGYSGPGVWELVETE